VNCKGIIPLLLFFLLLIPQASCIGIGASPDRIEFGIVDPNEGVVQELYVINTGSEKEQVLLIVDGLNLSIEPDKFDLDVKNSGLVNISIDTVEAGDIQEPY